MAAERHLIRPSVRTGAPSPQGEGIAGFRVAAFPLRGRWTPASHGSRRTDEVGDRPLLRWNGGAACRGDTSSAPVCTLGHLPLQGKALQGYGPWPSPGGEGGLRRLTEAGGRMRWGVVPCCVGMTVQLVGTPPHPPPAGAPSPQGEGFLQVWATAFPLRGRWPAGPDEVGCRSAIGIDQGSIPKCRMISSHTPRKLRFTSEFA